MKDDKYIGIEVLNNAVQGVTGMVENRNDLLQSMFKSDLRDDFLMKESAQGGMGGAGVDSIAPMGMGMMDLMPNSPTPPDSTTTYNLEESGINPDTMQPNIDGGITQKFAEGGITSGMRAGPGGGGGKDFSPQDKPSSKSLEESGFDDTFEKNISNKLEDDFKIDQRLKDAFGASLALPIKAAAVGLMGLLGKIPATSEEMQENITDSMTMISHAMGLSYETANQRVDVNNLEKNTEQGGNTWFSWFQRLIGRNQKDKDKPMGGNVTKLHGIGKSVNQGGGGGIVSTVQNFFGLAKDRDHGVSTETTMGGVVNALQQRRRMIEAFGNDNSGVTINGINQGGGGLTSIMSSLSNSMTNLGGSNTIANVFPISNMGGDISSTTNASNMSMLSDLTNNVLNQSNLLTQETTSALQQGGSGGGGTSTANPAIPNFDMESGTGMATSIVKSSIFFTEYANTAQFT